MDGLSTPVKNEIVDNVEQLPLELNEEKDITNMQFVVTEILGHNESQLALKNKIPKDDSSRPLNQAQKRKVFQTLLTKGCNNRLIQEVISRFKVEPEKLKEFFDTTAFNTQSHVHEECGSLSFENISQWLWNFEAKNLNLMCNFEAALVMKAIADNEDHPDPDQLAGIDLKSVYKFIGNALLGLPQANLDPMTGNFLANEFERLIDDANSDHADVEVRHMKQHLEQDVKVVVSNMDAERDRQSLDPLYLDNNIMKYL